MFRNFACRSLPLMIAASVACQGAFALDWTGYFRGGPGLTSSNANRACFGLSQGSAGMKYRLGNECDIYGEFQLSQEFKKDGLEYRASLMTSHWTGSTDTDGKGLAIEQMWGEAKGFDILPAATFWIGKERGRRGDVHIVDTYFVEMAGVGAGVKGIPIGSGQLGVAYYKTDAKANKPGNRLNVEWVNVAINDGGKLNLFGTVTNGDFDGGTTGAGLSARHDQTNLFGSGINNTLFLQYAQGSTALNANFGDLSADSSAQSWRLVESINWQKGRFGGQVMGLLATEKNSAGVKTDSASIGGRISYGFTKNFKFLTEVGYSQFKVDNMPTAKLAKVTLAPTLSIDSDFWSRPEFRLYATFGRWNGAAGNVTGQTAFDGKTSANSFGAQLEWWF